jgi:hypothetical protein
MHSTDGCRVGTTNGKRFTQANGCRRRAIQLPGVSLAQSNADYRLGRRQSHHATGPQRRFGAELKERPLKRYALFVNNRRRSKSVEMTASNRESLQPVQSEGMTVGLTTARDETA